MRESGFLLPSSSSHAFAFPDCQFQARVEGRKSGSGSGGRGYGEGVGGEEEPRLIGGEEVGCGRGVLEALLEENLKKSQHALLHQDEEASLAGVAEGARPARGGAKGDWDELGEVLVEVIGGGAAEDDGLGQLGLWRWMENSVVAAERRECSGRHRCVCRERCNVCEGCARSLDRALMER